MIDWSVWWDENNRNIIVFGGTVVLWGMAAVLGKLIRFFMDIHEKRKLR